METGIVINMQTDTIKLLWLILRNWKTQHLKHFKMSIYMYWYT